MYTLRQELRNIFVKVYYLSADASMESEYGVLVRNHLFWGLLVHHNNIIFGVAAFLGIQAFFMYKSDLGLRSVVVEL